MIAVSDLTAKERFGIGVGLGVIHVLIPKGPDLGTTTQLSGFILLLSVIFIATGFIPPLRQRIGAGTWESTGFIRQMAILFLSVLGMFVVGFGLSLLGSAVGQFTSTLL